MKLRVCSSSRGSTIDLLRLEAAVLMAVAGNGNQLSYPAATRMIASSLVKQIAAMGGDVTLFIPKEALAAVKAALKKPA